MSSVKTTSTPEETIFIIPFKLEECKVPRRLTIYQYVDYFPETQEEKSVSKQKKDTPKPIQTSNVEKKTSHACSVTYELRLEIFQKTPAEHINENNTTALYFLEANASLIRVGIPANPLESYFGFINVLFNISPLQILFYLIIKKTSEVFL